MALWVIISTNAISYSRVAQHTQRVCKVMSDPIEAEESKDYMMPLWRRSTG